ncbi:ATP-binding cassette domain-containing protein, partial [uncultured Azonexus sp.]|uniref:ATP-binding cassette domain-containing protein n=1 Tax=uncultured Azonexus sp. TaxID=520307 RepID=UPI002617FACB
MAHLDIRRLSKRYGQFVALDHIELAVDEGEFLVLLGPSGCGKSTVLRLIAGLITPSTGRLEWQGASPAPKREPAIGFVF